MEAEKVERTLPRLSFAAARVNAGLTQADAAKRLNITAKTLCYYETGKRKPRWDIVQTMADVYGVPIDFLRLT